MFPMLNTEPPMTSPNLVLTSNSLPHISPREYAEIAGRIDSVLALLRSEELHRLQNVFHKRACDAACQDAVGSVDVIETSRTQAFQAISYLRSNQLQANNPFLSQFLHHDIVGPLGTIVNYFNLLKECPDMVDLYPQVARMYPTIQDAEWFIASFTSSMKFWVDPSLVGPSVTSLEPLIQHAIFYAIGRAGRMPIVHLPHDFTVNIHEGVLSVLLVNIFKNALCRGGAGEIDVDSEEIENNRVRLTISDDGKGVADEIASKVFELGVSGAGSTGIGLGAASERLAPSGATIACVPRGGLPSRANPGQFGAKFIIEMDKATL